MTRIASAVPVLALLIFTGTTAQASADRSLAFRYQASELATAEGASKLHERIQAYARSECSTVSTPAIRNPRAERCTRELADQLIAQIKVPALSDASQATGSKTR